jgi:hypothetical protein
MAILYGPRDLKDRVLADGWDATELEKLRSESDITIEEITNLLAGTLAALNAELLADPWLSLLFNVTTEPTVEYRQGTTTAVTDHTEYGAVDEQRGATQGHMLPLKAYDYALGWTWDYLRKCRRSQVDADIQGVVQAWRDAWEKKLLTRFFQAADDSGAAKGLGSSGYSPGFAHTAGSTNVDFVPPPYEGKTFANTHEHFNFVNGVSAANWQTGIDELTADLFEHGHPSPFDLIVSYADQGTVQDLTEFRTRPQPEIKYGDTQDVAMVGEQYIGVVNTPSGIARVKISNRLPQYYMGCFKAYGVRNPRSPLIVRYSDDMGLVATLLRGKSYRQFPIEQLLTFGEFGVGAQDRTNGAACEMNSASWAADPTIS